MKKIKKCMRKNSFGEMMRILMKYEINVNDSCVREEKVFLNF